MKKIFLGVLILFLWLGGYFYFFPMYPNYNIPDDYFKTSYYDKDINSRENGYNKFRELVNFLNEGENKRLLEYYSNIYSCKTKDTFCDKLGSVKKIKDAFEMKYGKEKTIKISQLLETLEQAKVTKNNTKIEEINKVLDSWNVNGEVDAYEIVLQDITKEKNKIFKDTSKKQEFLNLLKWYFDRADSIESSGYIVYFNTDFVLNGEVLLNFSRSLNSFIFQNTGSDWMAEVVSKQYIFLSQLSYKLEGRITDSILIQAQMEMLFDSIKELSLLPEQKVRLRDVLVTQDINKDTLKTALKDDHKEGVKLLNKTFSQEKNFFNIFLYSEQDTENILSKIRYDQIEYGKSNLSISLNGKNLLGRTLIQWIQDWGYTLQSKRLANILQERQNIIDLLF